MSAVFSEGFTGAGMPRHRAAVIACLAVLLLSALLVAIPAGRRPFWASDEGRVALLARDALEHGRWWVADLRGEPYLNKPQLTFWGVALSSVPFGRLTETSAAIPGVLTSVAAVAGVIAIGWRIWGWTTGAVAGLVLATTPLQFDMGHQVLPDMPMTAWLVWALYFFSRAATVDRAATGGWALAPTLGFYLCITAALLSKGPAALAAVLGAAVAVAFTDGPGALRRTRPLLGAAVVLGVAAVLWLVPYHVRSAGAFQGKVITGHYVTWYTAAGSAAGRLESLIEPLIVFLPWTLLLAAAPFWWRQSPDPARRRIILWTATQWVLIAFSGHFRPRYVLPVLPGLALLTAEVVTAPVAGRAARALRWATLLTALFAIVIAVTLWVPSLQHGIARALMPQDRPYLPTALWERLLVAGFAVGAAAALVVSVRRRAMRLGAVGLGLALAAMFLVLGITYPARYTHAFDIRPLSAAAVAGLPPDAPLIGYPDMRLGYDIYTRRRIIEAATEDELRARLAEEPRARVIMPASSWETMAPRILPAGACSLPPPCAIARWSSSAQRCRERRRRAQLAVRMLNKIP
jgi:4-amino-4-deoxy-L-arabinose transferase-like glycosyltransferase